ncbi:MAG TPA: proteasome subunit beta [Actinobacteria bacterium]|nr:proteasome subunit beta [Actinomycetota bacterium]
MNAKWEVPPETGHVDLSVPEATTVMALRFESGVIMVGDRQATEGYSVAHRRMQKVFAADRYSAVAISGTAGLAIELVRLFQTELEHYEKLEGVRLSLDGKATYLARMVRGQLPMALQGLVVIPLFCGVDEVTGNGHVFTFDAVGGRYEEHDFGSTGSGSREAKSYLRTTYTADLDETSAVDIAMQALVAAADQDVATGGPDIRRGIYPNVVVVTSEGLRDLSTDETAASAQRALEVIR